MAVAICYTLDTKGTHLLPVALFAKEGGETMKKFLRAIPVIMVLALCFSLTALAYSGSTSVTLTSSQNEAVSSQLSCHHAKVSASNNASSAHNVNAVLQLSAGTGWTDYGQVTMSPGTSGNTGAWGRSDTVYLCRAKLWVPGIAFDGCTASGTLSVTD